MEKLTASDWAKRAQKTQREKAISQGLLIGFLTLVSIPVILPYFWMLTISFSAKTGGVESFVLWRSTLILIPALFIVSISYLAMSPSPKRLAVIWGTVAIALMLFIVLVGPHLHLHNYRFLWNPDIMSGRGSATTVTAQFPSVWDAFANSWIFATVITIVVVIISTLAAYYLSRFQFKHRSTMLQTLIVLHAFPAMTMVIPIFLIMYWIGMIDSITGVLLIVITLELPFSIFIMKGFFDAVPWDIEMAAITDGATRRQAFFQVVLPQVSVGMIAIGVFAFIKSWEEYVFVRTLLFEKSNWMMSLYLFWVSEDVMGVDYGIVAAVAVFYVLPSLVLYIFAQKYLTQMSFGGVKG